MSHKTRPRLVYPTAFDSEKVSSLTPRQFRLWVWMLTQADDEGRGQWWPTRAATAPCLTSPCTTKDAEADAQAICAAKLSTIYSVNGLRYYQMHDWGDYQKIRKDRLVASTYPCQPNGNQMATNCQPSDNQMSASSTNTSTSITGVAPDGSTGNAELPLNIQRSHELHLKEYHLWISKLRKEVNADPIVSYFIKSMEEAIADYYSNTGGKFTDHRKGRFGARMMKVGAESAMFAIEVFCDKYRGNKDERYIAGIAKQKDRLSEQEREAEIDRHRNHIKDRGLFYEATHAKV